MSLTQKIVLAFATIVPFLGAELQAGIVLSFSLSSSTVIIPSSGSANVIVSVRMAANSGTQSVRGYTIPIDMSPPNGTGMPTGISITNITPVLDFVGLPFQANAANPAEGDLLVSDGSLDTPINFTTTPNDVFQFTIAVAPNAAQGNYNLSFLNQILLSVNDGNGTRIPNDQMTLNSASLQVQAVPEPGSFFLLVAAASGGVLVRRFRSKKQA